MGQLFIGSAVCATWEQAKVKRKRDSSEEGILFLFLNIMLSASLFLTMCLPLTHTDARVYGGHVLLLLEMD
jgi:hypothetical protein